jgi:hypothetical protein
MGPTQPLTEMSTRYLPEGKGRPVRTADNLTAICEPTVKKMWEPRRLASLRASVACYRDIALLSPYFTLVSVKPASHIVILQVKLYE